MANVNDIYASKWLKAEDLNNQTVTVKIAGATVEEIQQANNGDKERRIVLGFEGANKRFILNKTQALQMVAIMRSADTDLWWGKSIMLSPAMSANGKPTIQILPPIQQAPAGHASTLLSNHGSATFAEPASSRPATVRTDENQDIPF